MNSALSLPSWRARLDYCKLVILMLRVSSVSKTMKEPETSAIVIHLLQKCSDPYAMTAEDPPTTSSVRGNLIAHSGSRHKLPVTLSLAPFLQVTSGAEASLFSPLCLYLWEGPLHVSRVFGIRAHLVLVSI